MDESMNDMSYDENDIEDFEDYLHFYRLEDEDTSSIDIDDDDDEEEIKELYF